MVWAADIAREDWVRDEHGRVLIFCPGCGNEVYADHNEEAATFTADCIPCGAVWEIDEYEADLYQPIWP